MRINSDSTLVHINDKNINVKQQTKSNHDSIQTVKISSDSVNLNIKNNNIPANAFKSKELNIDKFGAKQIAVAVSVPAALGAFVARSGGTKGMLIGAGLGAVAGVGFSGFVNSKSNAGKFASLAAGTAPMWGALVYSATQSPVKAIAFGIGGGALVSGYVLGRSLGDQKRSEEKK